MENGEVIKFQQPVQLSNVLEEDKNEEVTEMENDSICNTNIPYNLMIVIFYFNM